MAVSTRAPEDIRRDVMDQLAWDSRVDESNVGVAVRDRTAVLTGQVPTYPERSRAQEDAEAVEGIGKVDNRLTVGFREGYTVPPDGEILANIQSTLAWSPTVDATQIHVNVARGRVALTGGVASYWQRQRAEEIAADVAGVTEVHNELSVSTTTPAVADTDIRMAIESALRRNANIADDDRVQVEVREGVVTLKGTVHSEVVRRVAIDTARYTKGVLSVNDHLEKR
jgi:osmotically-inducible protein OsmY